MRTPSLPSPILSYFSPTQRFGALLSGLSIACAGLVSSCGSEAVDAPADEVAVVQSELSGPGPQLTAIAPNTGAATGGAKLTLTGKNFLPGTRVWVAGIEVTGYNLTIVSSTVITLTLPAKPGAFGRVPVVVTRPDGKSVTRADLFYYYSDKLDLRPASEFSRDGSPLRSATADLNGDGRPDYVYILSYNQTLAVALAGTTGFLQGPKVTNLAPESPTDLAIADFNGDKKLDVVIGTANATRSLILLLGNGDGTFAAPQYLTTLKPVQRVFAQDLNRDGKMDLFSGGLDGDFFSNKAAYQFLAGHGDGTFDATKQVLLPTTEWKELFLGDTDGDGKADLVRFTSSPQELRNFLGKGDGTFADPILAAALSGVAYSPEFATGDVNGDGKSDLLVERSAAPPALYLAKGDGTFAPPIDAADSLVGYHFALGDINGDGKLDLVSGNQSSAFYIGKGDGSFAPRQVFSTRGFSNPVLVDLNGDKRADLIGGYNLDVLINNNGTFIDPQSMPSGSKPSAVRLGDVNGDGKLDLTVLSYDKATVQVALGEGNGRFGTPRTFTTGTGPSALWTADLSGDGKADLVISNFDSSNVSLLLGNGDGTFATPRNFAVGNSPSDLVVADVNGDGKLDVATSNYDGDNVSVLLNTGGGSFSAAKNYPVQKFPMGIASGDLNGDGKADLVVINSDSNSVSVLLATTTGFATAKHTAVGKNPLAVVVADLNGDGKQDVAVASSDDNTVSVLLNSGTGTLTAATPLAVCAFPSDLAAADLDGDGRSDLAVSCGSSQNINYWIGFGDGAFFPAQSSEYTGDSAQLALGDTNGDAKTDLVYINQSQEFGVSLLNKSP